MWSRKKQPLGSYPMAVDVMLCYVHVGYVHMSLKQLWLMLMEWVFLFWTAYISEVI